jgi:hypothetical protein
MRSKKLPNPNAIVRLSDLFAQLADPPPAPELKLRPIVPLSAEDWSNLFLTKEDLRRMRWSPKS